MAINLKGTMLVGDADQDSAICVVMTEGYLEWALRHGISVREGAGELALLRVDDWAAAYRDGYAPAIIPESSHWSASRLLPSEIQDWDRGEMRDHVGDYD